MSEICQVPVKIENFRKVLKWPENEGYVEKIENFFFIDEQVSLGGLWVKKVNFVKKS